MSAYDPSLTLCQQLLMSHDSKYFLPYMAKPPYNITNFKNQWIYQKLSKSWIWWLLSSIKKWNSYFWKDFHTRISCKISLGTFWDCMESETGWRVKSIWMLDGLIICGTVIIRVSIVLTHLFPTHPFSTPCKHQKTLRFSDVFKG